MILWGLFDKLEQALAFDSNEVNAAVKDIALLKVLFSEKIRRKAPQYIGMVKHKFNDRDVNSLLEHFRDKDRRKEFSKEYKEIEMLYEIISPDAFLRPFMDDYATLVAIYIVLRKAYEERVHVDRAFQQKTDELVQSHVSIDRIESVYTLVKIDESALKNITEKSAGSATTVINLVKSIEKSAEENVTDPFLIAMAKRARAIQEKYENRQIETQQALDELSAELAKNEARKKEQEKKGMDSRAFFFYQTVREAGVSNAEGVGKKVRTTVEANPNWENSEAALHKLRQDVTIVVSGEMDSDRVAQVVNKLLAFTRKAQGPKQA